MRPRRALAALVLAQLSLGALAGTAAAGDYGSCEGPVEACATQVQEGSWSCKSGEEEGHGANTARLVAADQAAARFRGEQWCGAVESRRDTSASAAAAGSEARMDWHGVRGNQVMYFHRAIVVTLDTPAGQATPFRWYADRYPQPDGTKLASCEIGAAAAGQAAYAPCAMNHVPVLGEVFLRPVEPPPWGGWIPE